MTGEDCREYNKQWLLLACFSNLVLENKPDESEGAGVNIINSARDAESSALYVCRHHNSKLGHCLYWVHHLKKETK